MDTINAIILGIIQGLTEFLPVSSSGHLEIFKVILGENKLANESLLMTVILHFATACSTIVIFRKEIKKIITDLINFKKNESFWFSLKIVISMVPATFVGFFLESEVESLFTGNLLIVGGMLIITGLLLLLADKAKPSEKNINLKSAIIIGVSQAIAIIPGISRSGSTIAAGLACGLTREQAARFSFLIAIPAISGAAVVKAKDLVTRETAVDSNLLPVALGTFIAFVVGIAALSWLLTIVTADRLHWFAGYCLLAGSVTIMWQLSITPAASGGTETQVQTAHSARASQVRSKSFLAASSSSSSLASISYHSSSLLCATNACTASGMR